MMIGVWEYVADCDCRRAEVAAGCDSWRQEMLYMLCKADFAYAVQTRFCWLSLETLIFSGSHRLRRPEKVSVLRILIHRVPQEGLENALQGTFYNILKYSILPNGF